jgi:hypothetical protein
MYISEPVTLLLAKAAPGAQTGSIYCYVTIKGSSSTATSDHIRQHHKGQMEAVRVVSTKVKG